VDGAPSETDSRPIVGLVPGLTSNNNECYMLNLLMEAKKNGFNAVVIGYRGTSDMPLSTP